jgi:hypothetical protein
LHVKPPLFVEFSNCNNCASRQDARIFAENGTNLTIMGFRVGALAENMTTHIDRISTAVEVLAGQDKAL